MGLTNDKRRSCSTACCLLVPTETIPVTPDAVVNNISEEKREREKRDYAADEPDKEITYTT